ncbi:hypothetical protein PMIN07_000607 [Paraphaeosphaeria minitans]
MKIPKRKKRGPICAHAAATTPLAFSPALSAVRHIAEQITPLEDPTQPKLRRKRGIRNLRAEHVFDAELTGKFLFRRLDWRMGYKCPGLGPSQILVGLLLRPAALSTAPYLTGRRPGEDVEQDSEQELEQCGSICEQNLTDEMPLE